MALEEFEERLRNREPIEGIKQFQGPYVNCLLTINWDALVDCFAEDAILDLHLGHVQGKAEIAKLFKETISENHKGMEGPFVVHPIVSVDGDKAKGNWLLYFQYALPRKLVPRPPERPGADAPDWQQGFYDAEYHRENGKWKISYLRWRVRLISPLTASDRAAKNASV